MTNRTTTSARRSHLLTGLCLLTAVSASACNKNAAPAEAPAAEGEGEAKEEAAPPLEASTVDTDSMYVEGVAGGIMRSVLTLEAEVVSVDQEKRVAVLRGPEGNEVAVRVGKEAVNFYQVAPKDRVKVEMVRELTIYVNEEGKKEDTVDGTVAMASGAEEGDKPGGVIVASTKVTSKIKSMDTAARKATLVFEDGEEETFEVRPDVDMTRYKVGQEVIFLATEMLALQVEKL